MKLVYSMECTPEKANQIKRLLSRMKVGIEICPKGIRILTHTDKQRYKVGSAICQVLGSFDSEVHSYSPYQATAYFITHEEDPDGWHADDRLVYRFDGTEYYEPVYIKLVGSIYEPQEEV